MIDLRSDTVTKPTKEMLFEISEALVGDDVFQDDPTVKDLEKQAAAMFGKENALFTSSGTQSNLIAAIIHAPPGSEIIMDSFSHPFLYEAANIARFAGSQINPILTENGLLCPQDIIQNTRTDNVHHPRTSMVSIENTHNHGGGNAYSLDQIKSLFEHCQKNNLKLHIDGARIFNAITSQGYSAIDVGTNTDSLTFCLSKGLGCPIGSVLVGSIKFITEARKIRKALGGGMRQVGYLAAAGIYALETNIKRLKEDHVRATKLAEVLKAKGLEVNDPQTNIVLWIPNGDRNKTIEMFKIRKILCLPFKQKQIRFVTHLNYTDEDLLNTLIAIDTIL